MPSRLTAASRPHAGMGSMLAMPKILACKLCTIVPVLCRQRDVRYALHSHPPVTSSHGLACRLHSRLVKKQLQMRETWLVTGQSGQPVAVSVELLDAVCQGDFPWKAGSNAALVLEQQARQQAGQQQQRQQQQAEQQQQAGQQAEQEQQAGQQEQAGQQHQQQARQHQQTGLQDTQGCQQPSFNGSKAAQVHFARRHRAAEAALDRTREEEGYLQQELVCLLNYLEAVCSAIQGRMADMQEEVPRTVLSATLQPPVSDARLDYSNNDLPVDVDDVEEGDAGSGIADQAEALQTAQLAAGRLEVPLHRVRLGQIFLMQQQGMRFRRLLAEARTKLEALREAV